LRALGMLDIVWLQPPEVVEMPKSATYQLS
jgi:hypothetical protein